MLNAQHQAPQNEGGLVLTPEDDGRVPLAQQRQIRFGWDRIEPSQPLGEFLGRTDDQHLPILPKHDVRRRSLLRGWPDHVEDR